ncbi:hypothetical protein [Actinomyces ruminicola]|uniref:hypothetical protein n=1 Tax=Actinomyces ruminicola TaxID=332524 RepID=UPI00164FB369|nr:hypothetical protein [Actinomyces ruminicola]
MAEDSMGAYAIAGYQEARSSRSPMPIAVPYCMVLPYVLDLPVSTSAPWRLPLTRL